MELAGVRVRPDIVFSRQRVAVFVDGCFWHSCPAHSVPPKSNQWYWGPKLERNRERDRLADGALTEAGWKVLRIWEHATVAEGAELVAALVLERSPAGPMRMRAPGTGRPRLSGDRHP